MPPSPFVGHHSATAIRTIFRMDREKTGGRLGILPGEFGTLLRINDRAQCILSHGVRMLQEVLRGMNEASRGAWGWVAAFALLVSMGLSWRLLPLRAVPDSGEQVRDAPGLLLAVSRRPEFAFGFRNVLADVAWLQAVQVAGKPEDDPLRSTTGSTSS